MDSPGAQTPFALCTQEISTRLVCMCMCATLKGLMVQECAPALPPKEWSLRRGHSQSPLSHPPCGGRPSVRVKGGGWA